MSLWLQSSALCVWDRQRWMKAPGRRYNAAQAHLSGVSKRAMINEGESGPTRLGHLSVYSSSSCWETDWSLERGVGKKEQTSFFPIADRSKHWQRRDIPAAASEVRVVHPAVGQLSVNTNTLWCQGDSCYKGPFRSNGWGGSDPTWHAASHPTGHPGFSWLMFLWTRNWKTCRSGPANYIPVHVHVVDILLAVY